MLNRTWAETLPSLRVVEGGEFDSGREDVPVKEEMLADPRRDLAVSLNFNAELELGRSFVNILLDCSFVKKKLGKFCAANQNMLSPRHFQMIKAAQLGAWALEARRHSGAASPCELVKNMFDYDSAFCRRPLTKPQASGN